jgi:hypothetical protein
MVKLEEINETEDMVQELRREREKVYYDLLCEIRDLLVDIRRHTGRQISPG